MSMDHALAERVRLIIRSDPGLWCLLNHVDRLHLPDGWIAGGFVRNAVWNHLHGRPSGPVIGDVDVVWFDRAQSDASLDLQLEARLCGMELAIDWSVKNQARMHTRNNDPPYTSTADAMRAWPETATSVAIRRKGTDGCEVLAPYGLHDLFHLILRPTTRFATVKRSVFEQRVREKRWQAIWPQLQVVSA